MTSFFLSCGSCTWRRAQRRLMLVALVLVTVATGCGMPWPRSVADVDGDPDAELEKPPGRELVQNEPTFVTAFGALWRQINAVDGLVDALGDAWEDRRIAAMGQGLAKQLQFTNRIDFNVDDLNGPPLCHFTQPVDRRAQSVGDNRSIMQRLLSLVDDAAGLPLCNARFELAGHTYEKCALFTIDDMADFYLRAVAGTAVLSLHFDGSDAVGNKLVNPDHSWLPLSGSPMQWLTAIDGFVPSKQVDPACLAQPDNCLSYCVTARAANRLVFSTFDTRLDGTLLPSGAQRTRAVLARPLIDGIPYDALHAQTLFAWECDGFLEEIQPFVHAFVSRGQTQLLLQLLRLLHAHWQIDGVGSDGERGLNGSAGLVQLEPFFARASEQGLREAIFALGAWTQG